MLKQLFAAMNDLLDDIIRYYPKANGELKLKLDEQICHLRRLSDTIIDEWLQFEEKLAEFRPPGVPFDPEDSTAPAIPAELAGWSLPAGIAGAAAEATATADSPAAGHAGYGSMASLPEAGGLYGKGTGEADEAAEDVLDRGQGYFKLLMFPEAARHFERVLELRPEHNLVRMFLAMTYMYLRDWDEAQRHFLLLLHMTDHAKWQALVLNALGCIQAAHANLEQAERYFREAHEADPSFAGPMDNLDSCRTTTGRLTLYFGAAELVAL